MLPPIAHATASFRIMYRRGTNHRAPTRHEGEFSVTIEMNQPPENAAQSNCDPVMNTLFDPLLQPGENTLAQSVVLTQPRWSFGIFGLLTQRHYFLRLTDQRIMLMKTTAPDVRPSVPPSSNWPASVGRAQ